MNTLMLVMVLTAAKPGVSFDVVKKDAEGLDSPAQAITAIVGALYIMNVGLDEVFNPKLREM